MPELRLLSDPVGRAHQAFRQKRDVEAEMPGALIYGFLLHRQRLALQPDLISSTFDV